MRERLTRLIKSVSEAGVSRRISGVVGGMAVLVVAAVLVTAWWSTRIAVKQTTAERHRTADGVAAIVASRTDILLRESDLGAVRRQMIDVQAAGLVSSCRVLIPGVGVIASSDPQQIESMSLPEAWNGTPIVAEGSDGTARVVFEVPGRGQGVVEVGYERVEPAYGATMARAGGVALVAVCAIWLAFVRIRDGLATVASVGASLAEVAKGERRASVLRLGEELGTVAEAWNTLLDERDVQDRAIAQHQVLVAEMEAPGEVSGVVSVCDSLTHGLVIVGPDQRLVYVNGAAAVLLGRHREEMAQATCAEVFEDQSVRGAILACFESKSPVRQTLTLTRGEPGKEPDAELRVAVRSSESGNERYAGLLIEDVTQQRLADRSRNSFVAQATHELRTPLTNIRLYVEQAVDEGEADPKLRAQALNVINSEARRLERIVSDMLSVAEIEAGSLSIRPGDVRTDALFADLENDYTAQAAEKTIKLTFDLPPKMPVIRGDRDRLGQALHNLLGNALKYTPPGGNVSVRVEAPEQGGLVVHVIDSGIGIDPEECERIFDRFYRANDRRIAHVTGSGLGLALAREIARLHGGDIEVESKLDAGSTFTIVLPGADEAGQKRAA